MQKILIILILAVLLLDMLYASQDDDLRFIIGLYRDSNFRLAKTEMIKFKDNYPDSRFLTDVDFLLANIYLRAREYEEAQGLFEDLYNDPSVEIARPDVLQGLAQVKFFQGDLTGSALLFNKFISDYPEHDLYWNALYFLGRIAVGQSDYNSASYYYLEAAGISNDLQISIAQLDLFLITNNYSDAEDIMEKMLHDAPDDNLTDQALVKLHNYNLQVRDFDKILLLGLDSIDPGSPYFEDYKLILGITRYEMGNYQKALQELEGMDSERAEYYKALCYVEFNQTVKAVELFEKTKGSDNIEISSNSYFYIARLAADLDTSIELLQNFIQTYPAHIHLSAAEYQLGYNYFQQENYREARKYLENSTERGIDPASREKAIFLIAEADHQLEEDVLAYQEYNTYLESYPRGQFSDEALFKLGLYLYRKDNHPEAFVKFDQLINDHPESAKVGMSRFYIGEMFYDQNKYFEAERHFKKAKDGLVDQGLVELRLAQISFFLKEYSDVESNLPKIPDQERYIFDKNILAGNLYFIRNDYETALEAYDTALQHAPSDEAERKVMNRKAWTLYQMRDYGRAAEIYQALSNTQEGDPSYLLKAASSAFSAQDYSTAIDLYEDFLELYPDSNEIISARIGISNSHYNKGEFKQSALYYRELINPEIDAEIRKNALNGLRWSCEQEPSLEYLAILIDIQQEYDDVEFETDILKDKIIYLDSKGRWQEVLQTFNQLDQSAADEIRNDYFQFFQARAMTNLEYYDQADQVFGLIKKDQLDAEVYSAWADLKLMQKDELGAIDKLRAASQISRDYNIWLPLLELEQNNEHEMFLDDYHKFKEFAGLQEQQQAQVLWVKWKLEKSELSGLDEVIGSLSESKYSIIKANAQLLKGLHLYKTDAYEDAIPELLRVRYLYQEFGEVRMEAEYHACLAYIKAERKSEAEELFELIREELSPQRISNIEQELEG